jgi:hypothetical protein
MKSLTGRSKKRYPAYVDKAESKLRNSPELKGLYQKIAHLKNCRDFKQYEYAKLQLYRQKELDYVYWISVIVDFLNV